MIIPYRQVDLILSIINLCNVAAKIGCVAIY